MGNRVESNKKYYAEHKEACIRASIRWQNNHPYMAWASMRIRGHRSRGYEIKITHQELIKLAQDTVYCRYCGIKLDWKFGHKNRSAQSNSPSMDRINNGRIIKKSNIQIICMLCNISKQCRTHKNFIKYCEKVFKRAK